MPRVDNTKEMGVLESLPDIRPGDEVRVVAKTPDGRAISEVTEKVEEVNGVLHKTIDETTKKGHVHRETFDNKVGDCVVHSESVLKTGGGNFTTEAIVDCKSSISQNLTKTVDEHRKDGEHVHREVRVNRDVEHGVYDENEVVDSTKEDRKSHTEMKRHEDKKGLVVNIIRDDETTHSKSHRQVDLQRTASGHLHRNEVAVVDKHTGHTDRHTEIKDKIDDDVHVHEVNDYKSKHYEDGTEKTVQVLHKEMEVETTQKHTCVDVKIVDEYNPKEGVHKHTTETHSIKDDPEKLAHSECDIVTIDEKNDKTKAEHHYEKRVTKADNATTSTTELSAGEQVSTLTTSTNTSKTVEKDEIIEANGDVTMKYKTKTRTDCHQVENISVPLAIKGKEGSNISIGNKPTPAIKSKK